ncbi:hypothetical protein NDU88_004865 [Pleurodeles waltl]|uniref:Uncharacterized protein n=1 Tax=Pleurodeles waltl TaxID=8319 RepID=A0AAV7QGR0_PLEWA|nr:hypothetical protein NDU88_004865 [Pleurodeles waltl]
MRVSGATPRQSPPQHTPSPPPPPPRPCSRRSPTAAPQLLGYLRFGELNDGASGVSTKDPVIFSLEDTGKAIALLKPAKAPGPDKISSLNH